MPAAAAAAPPPGDGSGLATTTTTAPPPPPPPPKPHRHHPRTLVSITLLGLGWALAASGLFVQVSTTSLVVNALRPNTPLATVPIALFFFAAAATLVPLSLVARRMGRWAVYSLATLAAIGGAALQLGAAFVAAETARHQQTAAAGAATAASTAVPLAMLSVGALLQGPSFASANNYRFAAAEFVDDDKLRPRAISLVVFCGILAAGLGPEVSRVVAPAVKGAPYAGSYAYLSALYAAQLVALACVDWRGLRERQAAHAQAAAAAEEAKAKAGEEEARPLAERDEAEPTAAPSPPPPTPPRPYRSILLTKDFAVAAACCAGAFGAMAALMALTPLRVVSSGLGADVAAHTVVAHVVAMYLPALLMGDAVRILGVAWVAVAGFAVLLAGTLAFLADGSGGATGGGGALALGGLSPASSYFAGMILIGFGWAGAYVASSSLAASCYAAEPPSRRFPIQAAIDSCVLLVSGVAMGSATPLLRAEGFGWFGVVVLWACVDAALMVLAAWWGLGRWWGREGGGMRRRRRRTVGSPEEAV